MGGSIEKQELGVQQTLLIQNTQSQLGPTPPSTPTSRVVPASSASGRDPYALEPTPAEVPSRGELLTPSSQAQPGQQYPHVVPILFLLQPLSFICPETTPGTEPTPSPQPWLQGDWPQGPPLSPPRRKPEQEVLRHGVGGGLCRGEPNLPGQEQ